MKSRSVVAVFVVLVALVGLVLAGCGGSTTTSAATTATTTGPTTTGATTDTTAGEKITVKIGLIAPLTGQLAKFGEDSLNASQMAVDEFNASGRLPNVNVVIEKGDDAADPAKAAILAEKFVADPAVMAILGPMNSSSGQAALPILEKAKLVLVSQSMTNVDLAKQGYTVFHRTCPKDDDQGYAIAKAAVEEVKAKKVFMIDDKTTYGQGLADQVEAELKKLGVTDIKRQQITPDDKDFSALITNVRAYGPDVFIAAIPSPAQYAVIAKQMQAQGYKVQLMGSDGSKDQQEFIANAGGATEGAYVLSLGPLLETSDAPAAKEFVAKYEKNGWAISLFSGQTYEAATVILNAIEAAYKKDPKLTREAILAEVKKTDYPGLTGIQIKFTPEGNLVEKGVFLIQVQGDKFVQIKPII